MPSVDFALRRVLSVLRFRSRPLPRKSRQDEMPNQALARTSRHLKVLVLLLEVLLRSDMTK